MMKAVAYIRVSTSEQATGGVSLAAQRAKAEAYAALYDLDLVAVVEDAGFSAKTLDRPGLRRVLDMLAAGEAEGVLVAKLDRLTRSVRDLGELLEGALADAALLSVAEQVDTRTAAGRLVLNVLTSVAQWERETGSERTSAALVQVKAEGGRIGRDGFGWTREDSTDAAGRRVCRTVDAELATVERILAMRAAGATYEQIATDLNAEQVPTKRGGRWYPTTVRNIALRPL